MVVITLVIVLENLSNTQRNNNKNTVSSSNSSPMSIVGGSSLDPYGDNHTEHNDQVKLIYDNDKSTCWTTQYYIGHSNFGNIKRGVGVILNLGQVKKVNSILLNMSDGSYTFDVRYLSAGQSTLNSAVDKEDNYTVAREVKNTNGGDIKIDNLSITTQYILIWLKSIPQIHDGNYQGRICDIKIM